MVKYQQNKRLLIYWAYFYKFFSSQFHAWKQRKIDIKNKNEDKANSVAIKINEVLVIPWQSKLKQAFAF